MSKEKKDNSGMIIAIIGLIGTLVAAALGSPLLVELLKDRQATETPPGIVTEPPVNNSATPDSKTPGPPEFSEQILVFREDFDSDNISGFSYDVRQWQIGKDKSNRVLEGDSTTSSPDAVISAIFGPSDFTNGIIEFRIRVNQFASDTTASLRFRSTDQATYALSFMQNQVILGYRDSQNDWYLEPFTSRSFLFEAGVWYLVRLEARGTEFTIYIDNNRLFSASDNRLQKGGLEFTLNPGYRVMFDDVTVWELK